MILLERTFIGFTPSALSAVVPLFTFTIKRFGLRELRYLVRFRTCGANLVHEHFISLLAKKDDKFPSTL